MSEPIFLDLETTGFKPKTDRILEIGLIVGDVRLSLLIDQTAPIPSHITELTGITDRMVDLAGCTLFSALATLKQNFSQHLTLVGHNILAFDYPFLLAEAERAGIDLGITPDRIIDTAVMYLGHQMMYYQAEGESNGVYSSKVMRLRPPKMKYNLALACDNMGIDISGMARHRAVADCLFTQKLYEALLDVMPEPVKPAEGVGVVRL